jgi:hypothetical protein
MNKFDNIFIPNMLHFVKLYGTILNRLHVRAQGYYMFSICGGEKGRSSEDTSRSGKGLAPSALPLFSTM